MNRKPSAIPIETWEIFSACIHYLGMGTLAQMYGRNTRQVERWSTDQESRQRNPIDRLRSIVRRLMELDVEPGDYIAPRDVARMVAILFARDAGGRFLYGHESLNPDKPTLAEECLDDIPRVSELHRLVMARAPLPLIRDAAAKAHREIDETVLMAEREAAP